MIDGGLERKRLWPNQGARSVHALTKIRIDYHPNTNHNCNHLGQCSRSYAHGPFLSDMATLNTDAANSSNRTDLPIYMSLHPRTP
jgi:hypothetical protein